MKCPECGVDVAEGYQLTHIQTPRRGEGGLGRGTPQPTPRGGPGLPGIFPEKPIADLVPGRGMPEWGVESDQPPDSLCEPPRTGHNCDPEEG